MKNETLAVHGGYDSDPTTKAVAVPIYQTVAYEFDSADHGAALFNLEVEGHRYSRISNPTVAVLERRVAALEGGVDALCASTGQAALNYAVLNLTAMGTNIVSVPQLYGTTHTLFAHILPSQGITVRFAESDRPDAIEKLIDDNTRAHLLRKRRQSGRQHLRHRSAGRRRRAARRSADRRQYGGHADPAAADRIRRRHRRAFADQIHGRPWHHARRRHRRQRQISLERSTPSAFRMFNEPDASYHGLIYTEHFGEAAYIARCRSVYQRTTGAVLSPLSAFLLLQGIETVALRVERHVENARRVAEFLRQHPRVEWVNYAGFADNPYHALAQKYLGGRACSLLTFGIVGGLEAGKAFYDALKLFKRLVNMGDAKSLACHPASTTHRQMSADEQRKAGVRPEMIRLSVGIEHIDDIIADLDQALAASQRRGRSALIAAE